MIDDNEKDLKDLSYVFLAKGIGCKTFVYDSFYNKPLKGVRVLFMDINLNGAQSDQQRNSTLYDAIIRYLHEDNGPFVLVFWTNNIEWVNNFIDYVNRDLDTEIMKRRPYYITYIDKTEFYNPQNSLEDTVKKILKTPIVSMLFDYENAMSVSISKTMSQLLNIIPHGESWGDNDSFITNAQKVFSTIAVQMVGYDFAKEDPDRAIKESMIPVFSDSFLHIENKIWGDFFSILNEPKPNICFPEDFNEAKLNNIFNVEYEHIINKEDRGAVCPVIDKNELFLDLFHCLYTDWYHSTFPDVTKQERNDSQLICVEFSAACDFSQKKKRTNKYLLGSILPVSVLPKLEENRKNGNYLLLLPFKIEVNGTAKLIAFNLNYSFTISHSVKDRVLGNPLFGLKKEIMDMIGNRYANHISRIGITSFR